MVKGALSLISGAALDSNTILHGRDKAGHAHAPRTLCAHTPPMSARTRQTLYRGIYRDKFGIAIKISVQGKAKEFRKDARGVSYKNYRESSLPKVRDDLKAAHILTLSRAAAKGEQFAADAARYLDTIRSASHKRNATGYLKYWTEEFGDRQRNQLTELEIETHFATIRKAPSTLNHIRQVLIAFYTTLNGRTGYNPAKVLKKVREQYDNARALPYPIIEQIFAQLAPTPTKARLMVMAYTGLPPALIEQITPHDLHLNKKAVYVKPRRKGAGVAGRMLPLSQAGVEAFRLFASLHAYGTFQRKQLRTTFENGIKWAHVTVPEGTRPYDLRHSFLTEVYRATGDLRAVAELGMHATLEQTARYARAAVSERATKAVAQLPRTTTKTNRGAGPKPSNSLHFGRVSDREVRGSNQYRKTTKSREIPRKKPVTRS